MKRITALLLLLALLASALSITALADPLDENGDTGGDAPGGTGSLSEYWASSWYGMRITVIDVSDSADILNGTVRGKVAAGTVSVDITNLTSSSAFFIRATGGDGTTPLTLGTTVTHFGKVSKMAYRDGEALASTTANYTFQTVTGLPKLMGSDRASAQEIKDFINNEPMLTNIADWCGGGLTYETLTSGQYKILAEPVMYCLVGTTKYAFTPTEAALAKPHGNQTGWPLINNTLANAFFLEYDELGWYAWSGSTNTNQPFQTIIDDLGMHIYSIAPEVPESPSPSPSPSPSASPSPSSVPPASAAPPVEVDFRKVEYGTNIGLAGAVFKVVQLSHWEKRLVDPNESENPGEEWELVDPDDGGTPQDNAVVVDKSDDVWEWLEIHSYEVVGTFVSGADGTIPVGELEAGSYTIEEISPPAGYALQDDINERLQSFDIPREGGYANSIVFANKKLPGLTVLKVDEDTGAPLSGAEFSIKHNGNIVYEGLTDASGIINLAPLEEGWYEVTELAAPSGYLISTETKSVYLEASAGPSGASAAQLKFDNRRRPTLVIKKIDAQGAAPLSGAKFRVTKADGATVGEYITGADGTVTIPNLDEAVYSVEEILAPAGYLLDSQHQDIQLEWGKTKTLVFSDRLKPGLTITKIDEQTGERLADAHFRVESLDSNNFYFEGVTNANGQISLSDLPEGIYEITETAAPDGYIIANHPKQVELKGDSIVNVTFTNRKKPTLVIVKLDEETKQPLTGAKFKVWKTEDNTVSEYVTGADGTITIPNLDEAVYSIEEIVAPDHYVLNPQHKDVEPEWGKTTTVVYTNLKKPTLTIIKLDELTNEPLAGASFRLWKTEGETWSETLVTDANGKITWTDLDPGIYSVQEIDEPYGYFPDASRKEILLEGGDNKQLEFFNRPRPVLTILKRDAVTGEPIANTKFKVQKTEGETIGEFLTDANGMIVLSPATGYLAGHGALLEEAVYTVTEIAPPNEYLLSDNPAKQVLLKWYEPTELVYENLLKPTLLFIKRDGLSGRGISGATYKVEYESADGGVTNLGSYVTKCGIIEIPYVLPGWYVLTETAPAPGYSLPTNPVQRLHLAAGENSYTYEQTHEDLYVDPRTNPNSGSKGNCEICGYLCSVLCAGNCAGAGGGTMATGSGGAFGNMVITNGNGDVISGAAQTDTTAPKLTAGTATRLGNLTATVQFNSSEAGRYYTAYVSEGAAAPNVSTSGTGAACAAGLNTITVYITSGAKDLYIKVKDAAGNISDALKIEIPAYGAGESSGATSSPEPTPSVPVSNSGGVVWLNPDFANITISIGNH